VNALQIEVLARAESRVGEGPVWDEPAGAVHWVDILAGLVHTTTLADGVTSTIQVPTLVGAAAPREAGGFALATAEGFASIDAEGRYEPRQSFLPDGVRMNDAKCDPTGRFWAGSCAMDFAAGRGALHVLEPDWTYRTVLDGITQPNGLGWSPDGSTFYLVDTVTRELLAFDADLDRGTISGQRTLVRFGDDVPGVPDGMSVDAAGDLWIAFWGGGQLLRVAPSGRTRSVLPVPVRQPSSCAFAGAELEVLCVTSAREGLTDLADDALDGSVLIVTGCGARGRPVHRFAG
jgi:sugar lactone lactonase YvrE